MTTTQLMPSAADYVDALQHPAISLGPADLRTAVFRTDPYGVPIPISGAAAVVFHVMVGSQARALRCFTARPGDAAERYRALDAHRARHDLADLARAEWREDAVTVRRRTLPVVVMDWVDGVPLDAYVARVAATDPASLADLAERWRQVVRRLGAADVAHGDLQHGNVLVGADGAIRLVDFDGLWLPTVSSLVPQETGHPNYQHPGRGTSQPWGRWVDAFAALSIYASLLAIAEAPQVARPFGNGDNLLFTAADFREPGDTDVWRALAGLKGPGRDAVALLYECCTPGWSHEGLLEDLLAGTPPVDRSAIPGPTTPPGGTSTGFEPEPGFNWDVTLVAPGSAAPWVTSNPPGATGPTGPTAPATDWNAWWGQHEASPRPSAMPTGGRADGAVDPVLVIGAIAAVILLIVVLANAFG